MPQHAATSVSARATRRSWAATFVLVLATSVHAETAVAPAQAPPESDALTKLLSAPYLTPDELADKRIFFGRWEKSDLNTPQRAARAALIRGVYDDPSFDDPSVDPLDRAEAQLLRGEPELTLKTLAQLREQKSPKAAAIRAVRLQAAALESLGRIQDALAASTSTLAKLAATELKSPADVVDAVRILAQRLRLGGPTAMGDPTATSPAGDYQFLMQALGEVRTRLDRQYWPAMLEEARLLYAHDNPGKAQEAAADVLALNPSCAGAWQLLGRITVGGFAFEKTDAIARRLVLIAADTYDPQDPDAEPPADLPAPVSPAAACLVAHAYIRQIDGAEALAALEPALARYPDYPNALALKAAADAVKFDPKATAADLAAFDAKFGKSPLAQLEVGKALSEARQYDQAATYLEEANKRSPFDPEPLIERGLLAVQDGQDDIALTVLEQAFQLDPFNVRVDNSLRLVREMLTYTRIETPHFIIRYKPVDPGTPAPDSILAHEMAGPLEENHRLVTGSPDNDRSSGNTQGVVGSIDHDLPAGHKTIIDLMPDHQWFAVRIAGMPDIHTIAAATGPLIAMEAPREGPNHLGTYDWVRVLRHEYTHTITLDRTHNRIPHWFTEAAAVYLELSPRDYSTCRLLAQTLQDDELFDFDQINIAYVRPKRPQDRSLAYAQSEWMYSYIVERFGCRAPLELMDQYANGVREEEAFQTVLHESRSAFFDAFKAWAKKQVIAWGLALPKDIPGVDDLIEQQNAAEQAKSKDATPPATAPAPLTADAIPPALLKQWLEKYPNHPDLLELAVDQAVAEHGGKAVPEIVPLIERYAAARPVDPKPHRLLAKMYLDAARADPAKLAEQAAKAIPHLEFLDQREQRSTAYAIELAKRYAALGDFPKAIAKANRATELSPFDPAPRELAATIALEAKNYDMAEHELKVLVQIEPDREIHKRRLEALQKLRAAQAK